MKFSTLTILLLCLLPILCGCDKDKGTMIWDFTPQHFEIKVVDEAGNNLLEPTTDGAWNVEDIIANYKDTDYQCTVVNNPLSEPMTDEITRELPAYMRGLRTAQAGNDRVLFFGDFSPANNYKQIPLILKWPDGSQSTFTFDCYIIWHSEDNPEVVTKLYHEGKEMEMTETKFGKQVTIRK